MAKPKSSSKKKSQSTKQFGNKIVKGQIRKAGKKRKVATEPDLWKNLDAIAVGAFDFWQAFFDLLMGPNNDNQLNATAIANFRRIIRSVSWVESKHSTAGSAGNFPSRDPMQCGNPLDAWWKVLIGGSPKTERFVGGPSVKNYWAEELPAAAAIVATFPHTAKLSNLVKKTDGHKDKNFDATTSFYWAVPILIQKINKIPSGATYKCDDATKARVIDGAVAYNGGGDPQYRKKIEDAWTLITEGKQRRKKR